MCNFKLAWRFQNIILSTICVNENNISVHLNHKVSIQSVIQRKIITKQKNEAIFLLALSHCPRATQHLSPTIPGPPTAPFYYSISFPSYTSFQLFIFFQNTHPLLTNRHYFCLRFYLHITPQPNLFHRLQAWNVIFVCHLSLASSLRLFRDLY